MCPPYACQAGGIHRERWSLLFPFHICPDPSPAALTVITMCKRRMSKTRDEEVKGCFPAILCPCRVCLELRNLSDEPSGNPAVLLAVTDLVTPSVSPCQGMFGAAKVLLSCLAHCSLVFSPDHNSQVCSGAWRWLALIPVVTELVCPMLHGLPAMSNLLLDGNLLLVAGKSSVLIRDQVIRNECGGQVLSQGSA